MFGCIGNGYHCMYVCGSARQHCTFDGSCGVQRICLSWQWRWWRCCCAVAATAIFIIVDVNDALLFSSAHDDFPSPLPLLPMMMTTMTMTANEHHQNQPSILKTKTKAHNKLSTETQIRLFTSLCRSDINHQLYICSYGNISGSCIGKMKPSPSMQREAAMGEGPLVFSN